ncbi:acyl-coenzyme A thioesterase 13 isoform X2 [Hyposmocoma kahamanoa]|uniref:acyl-coenzyme A thioesterase 13 isoform X2 n=1 Tax=Hyposmocoma kahamanoa TaxID=1477025 RepID=UPI000E6D6902|nr:acyl-coenzyme A thioesterase 13 isoform X2 [Hyposmocoma kahamanoa]
MSTKGAKVAELFTKAMATTKCFDQNLRQVKVVCCAQGRMVTEFKVGPEHLNQRGSLHGGFIALLVDAISTYALTANDKVETRGLSIDLSVTQRSLPSTCYNPDTHLRLIETHQCFHTSSARVPFSNS